MPARSKNPSVKNAKPASLKDLAAYSTLQPGKITKYSSYAAGSSLNRTKAGPQNYQGGAAIGTPDGFAEYTIDFSLDFTS